MTLHITWWWLLWAVGGIWALGSVFLLVVGWFFADDFFWYDVPLSIFWLPVWIWGRIRRG